ncbi:hypothetical protein B0H16DRAFT_1573724 [Mycena metata]|uniref:Uncharacterized protein n=1 Tax=Mycena metata TaxID=1033252 RepID=A0AAD7MXJ5_9AGAR|nr:hypothetical protein B0H16DRAFT_1573724 [Mycena metata]
MEPHFTSETTAEDVAAVFATEIVTKNVLITGTSINGLGFESARVIAKHANLVIITGYNEERLKLSQDALQKEFPSANIRHLILDLSSMASVRKAAAEVNAYAEPIHVLINNAAAPLGKFKITSDGLERQIAIDHVGPFLFTKLLVPKLLASATPAYTPRVVVVASNAHRAAPPIDFSTLFQPDEKTFDTINVYGQAKSANILAMGELARRAQGKLNAYALHPGVIYTNMVHHPETLPVLQQAGVLDQNGNPTPLLQWRTIPQGAAPIVIAAFDPRLNDRSGAYLEDCQIATETIAPHTSDPARAETLWKMTEAIIGEEFTV